VTFIDDHSRCLWLFPIHYKSDVFSVFKTFKSMVELQTGRLIKAFQTDNGGEYMLAAFRAFLAMHGIIHRTTVAYTSKQNGLAEQHNRTIVKHIRTMLLDGNLSSGFWAEAAKTAAYLINVSPATKLGDQTPREAFTSEKPWIAALRPFGCPAYAHIPKEKRKKLDTKTQKCVMIGYEPGSKAYRLWNPSTRTIIKARDVIFDEHDLKSDAVIRIDSTDFRWPGADRAPGDNPATGGTSPDKGEPPSSTSSSPAKPVGVSSVDDAPSDDNNEDGAPPPVPDAAAIPASNAPGAAPRARCKRRTEAELLGPAIELGVCDCRPRDLATRSAIPLVERGTDRAPAGVPEPEDLEDLERSFSGLNIDKADGPDLDTAVFVYVDIPPELDTDLSDAVMGEIAYALAAAAAAGEAEADPRTLREAEQSSKWPAWQAAIEKEHDALFNMGTFGETVHRLPPGRRAIDSKLVFKTKYLADGSVEREKVRLVAKGFSQVPGLDFDETFAPVVKLTSLRILCAIAVRHRLFFDILDVETAYLHGHLEEELYIQLPKGFGPDGDEIKRLVRSIYGLKQSGRVWNELLHEVLSALGYTRLDSEHGVGCF
jgi:hypothetical protein